MAKTRRIAIIDGHPDGREGRFVHALASSYAEGARAAGHEVITLTLGNMDIPLLRRAQDFASGQVPQVVRTFQKSLAWADHWVILYPLWLGSMPALLKGFFEQTLRPGFAFAPTGKKGMPRKLLEGKSARIIVTMGMPALFYRWYFRAHSLKSLERNILGFCGIAPVRSTVVGMVENKTSKQRAACLKDMQALGGQAR
jgi:putative NADPH-quinone reductase